MFRLDSPPKSTSVTRALRAGQPFPIARDVNERNDLPDSSLLSPTVSEKDISRDDLTGLFLGPYALGAEIGSGGMGKVFKAKHVHLDRVFAIKFVATDIAGDAETQLRFEQETRALGHLQHPQIVNAVDAGCINRLKYLVTEFIEGEDLWNLAQRRGGISPREACELIRQAAVGLAYSHGKGFVHRDIKPSNLMLNGSGVVKILDFGLVCHEQADTQLTEKGATLGTWDFIAPEQAHDSSEVDERCDIYSLGCTLLYLLSGRPPFSGARYTTAASKLKGHLFDTPPWLERPPGQIPQQLIEIVTQMMAKSPAQRFQTAEEVAVALGQYTSGSLPKRQKDSSASPRRRWRKRQLFWPAAICLVLYLGRYQNPQPVAGVQDQAPVESQISSAQKRSGPSQPSIEAQSTTEPVAETPLVQPIQNRPELVPNRITVTRRRMKNALPIDLTTPNRPINKSK